MRRKGKLLRLNAVYSDGLQGNVMTHKLAIYSFIIPNQVSIKLFLHF